MGLLKDMKNGTFQIRMEMREMSDRLEKLENTVNKTKRKDNTSRGQQILILYHLGLLDKINELNLSNVKKAKLLATLLNSSEQNIRQDLTEVYKQDSELKHSTNYTFLNQLFSELGLNELEKKTDKILVEIQNLKDSSNN